MLKAQVSTSPWGQGCGCGGPDFSQCQGTPQLSMGWLQRKVGLWCNPPFKTLLRFPVNKYNISCTLNKNIHQNPMSSIPLLHPAFPFPATDMQLLVVLRGNQDQCCLSPCVLFS